MMDFLYNIFIWIIAKAFAIGSIVGVFYLLYMMFYITIRAITHPQDVNLRRCC